MVRTGRCLSLEVASRGMGISLETQKNRIEIRRLIEEKCEAVKKLPAHKKLLFLMYYDHGHSMREIAEVCGIAEETVRRRLTKIANEINKNENSDKGD